MTKEEFIDWKQNRVTQEVLDYLRNSRSSLAEQLIVETTEGNNVRAMRCACLIEAFDSLINIDYEGDE